MTPAELARREIEWLLTECHGGLEFNEYGLLQYYNRVARERVYFEPMWNSFDHPIHNVTPAEAEIISVIAMQIITNVMRQLFP